MTKHHADAAQYVTTSLGDYTREFDIDAIVEEVHDHLGHYDFDQLDTDEHMDYDYNAVLQKHDIARDLMGEIVTARKEYLHTSATLKQRSDDLIREGIKEGYTMYAIAKATGLSETAVAKIRDQSK